MLFDETYHPTFKALLKLMKDLQLFLYKDSEGRRVFSIAPIVSYRSARKIKNYIVRWELNTVERKVGSCRCGKPKCQGCTSKQVTDTFCSFVTKSGYTANHDFNCNSKCLIYLLKCKTCSKQYTGKTVDKFSSRWINYNKNARKAASGKLVVSCKQQIFFKIIFYRITIMYFRGCWSYINW